MAAARRAEQGGGFLYRRLAWLYDLVDWPAEHFQYPKWRSRICGDVRGHVLDVGSGTGKNFAYFPREAEVEAVDASPWMVRRAGKRARRAAARVHLTVGDGRDLPFQDATFDVVVATFYLCVVSQPDRAAQEIARVLKPGGEARTLDFVHSRAQGLERWIQTLTSWVFGADPHRRPDRFLEDAGLPLVTREFLNETSALLLTAQKPGGPNAS
ncbi:MAG: class I SAM-dependent methyltransferase [Armatimonadetes bacterium]|nr:class I SAM-dependent methyltransferase [Armatimonadota bacterium]